MRRPTLLGLIPLLAWASVARAQPMMGAGMPNLAEIVGRPLPDLGMPVGTVSVRVSRQLPANAVGGVEVSAIIKNAGGDSRRRAEKTDASGRVLFEGMAPGDGFRAEVTVGKEVLTTETFTLPAEGGLRTMLIADLGTPVRAPATGGSAAPSAAGAAASVGDEPPPFVLGATAGVATADAALPAGTLEVRVLDESGAPIGNHAVLLGMIDQNNKIDVRHGKSDGAGLARFTGLPTGDTTGYAAVVEWHGTRLGTAPFPMPSSGGARAEIRALARTADPSVMTIGAGARIVVQMHEDTLQFLELFPFENNSDKMFDPGPGAIEIPLPSGFVSAQAQENERKIDVRQNHGMAVHGAFTPKRATLGTTAKNAGHEVTFGFVLPYHGRTRDFVQPMPNGIGPFTLITEQIPGLTVSGRGIGERQERELGGRKYWVMPVDAVPPGGSVSFVLDGLPSTDATGRNAAGILALALVAAAIVFGRRPKEAGKRAQVADQREQLVDRREALYADLVAFETTTRGGGAPPPERRKQLVGRLEQVYRELAALDEQRAT
ncbi:MAG TPA: hypothetical protein VFG23_24820 [Polyangia bacterium]|nr:hypothetical protein [Polyangia bacterium]